MVLEGHQKPMNIDGLKQRLSLRLKVDDVTGCWNWTGPKAGKGYGLIRVPWTRKTSYVHQAAWVVANGMIPAGMLVCHRCDNRLCGNPDHLFIGTHGDNLQDMKAKGRHLYGERNTKSKLTEAQVNQIHDIAATGVPQWKIADQFNVGQITVSRILRGERWNHVFLQRTASEVASRREGIGFRAHSDPAAPDAHRAMG
jgi:hypothetical protein